MEKNDEKLYIDNAGYQILLQEIEDLKQKLAKNGIEKGEAYSGAVGDGWHDNYAFDEANMQERMIIEQIRECYKKLQRVVIVETNQDNNLIDINDIVTINMIFAPDDIEEMSFKLVTSIKDGGNQDFPEVTINSPLGQAVYRKPIKTKTSYNVENRVFNIEILSKNSEENNLKKQRK